MVYLHSRGREGGRGRARRVFDTACRCAVERTEVKIQYTTKRRLDSSSAVVPLAGEGGRGERPHSWNRRDARTVTCPPPRLLLAVLGFQQERQTQRARMYFLIIRPSGHLLCPQVRGTLRDLEDKLEFVSTEEQREEAIALANELEEWLYDEGWDMDATTYRKKRAELAKVSVVVAIFLVDRNGLVFFWGGVTAVLIIGGGGFVYLHLQLSCRAWSFTQGSYCARALYLI